MTIFLAAANPSRWSCIGRAIRVSGASRFTSYNTEEMFAAPNIKSTIYGMQVELPDKTIRDVEAMLAKRGQNGNVSEFIDRTLQRALFFETVRDIKRQNTSADPQELDRLIDEAVAAARSGRTRTNPDANGA
jgi:hypothetical protein